MQTTQSVERKIEVLRAGGYRYHFDRQLYFNRDFKKAFSIEFVEDHSEDELAQLIGDESRRPEWQFFFNKKPSAAVEKELSGVLG